MSPVAKKFAHAAVAVTLLFAVPAARAATQDETQLIDRARLAVEDVKRDKEFGNATSLARRARAIMVVPRLFKAGFFVGGEGGGAVLLARGAKGWSAPAFYTLASASFGLQIGAQESEVIMFIMSERALQAVLNNEFKIGANAAFAIVTLGSSAELATTSALRADIVVWASSTGAYAGITLNGSVLKPSNSYNQDFYGQAVTPRDIVVRRRVSNPMAAPLQSAVATLG